MNNGNRNPGPVFVKISKEELNPKRNYVIPVYLKSEPKLATHLKCYGGEISFFFSPNVKGVYRVKKGVFIPIPPGVIYARFPEFFHHSGGRGYFYGEPEWICRKQPPKQVNKKNRNHQRYANRRHSLIP